MATITQISTFSTSPSQNPLSPNGQLLVDASGNLLGTSSGGGADNDGTVFEVANTGSGYASAPSTVASFDSADGSDSLAGLITDASGDLLGVAARGGANDDGTIFEITKTADGYATTPTVLASFDGSDGVGPSTPLAMDSAGDLFGVAETGGFNAAIFELAKTAGGYASAPTALAQLDAPDMPGPLVIDASGDLFGTSLAKSGPSTGTVFELANNDGTYAGTPTTLATFTSADGTPSGALIADAAGNLFGMTNGGGANGEGEIFEIAKTADGYAGTPTVLASFPSRLPSGDIDNNHGGSLLLDGADNLFATTLPSGGAVDGELFELPKTDGIYASTVTGVISLNGGGSEPLPGLTADPHGNLFGAASGLYPMEESPPVATVWEITGSGFVPTTASSGETLGAHDATGEQLIGTALNDTFYAGHNSVAMTGEGGADTFVFQFMPWNAGSITDFTPGTDKLDVSALLSAAGYTGHDPVADGYVTFQSDGSGDTNVYFDPHDPAQSFPTLITTLDGVSPNGLTAANTLTGSSSSGGGGGATGETLTANDTAGQQLTGTPNDDTFFAGHNAVVMTGDGGADTFVFQYEPWNAGSITDFTPGNDKLDLSALLSAAGYTGSDPVADGYVNFSSDGSGDTNVYFNPHDASQQWPSLITTLDGVAPSGLTAANTLGTAGSSSGGGGSGGGGGGTTGETLTANDTAGQQLTGTPNDDTFFAGHNSVVMTGDGGADSFVFQYQPWNAGSITDFNTATDVLNLKGIFASIGYTGHDPVADGYLAFQADGQGDTQVIVNPQGPGTQIPITVTTLDHVDPSMIHSRRLSLRLKSGTAARKFSHPSRRRARFPQTNLSGERE